MIKKNYFIIGFLYVCNLNSMQVKNYSALQKQINTYPLVAVLLTNKTEPTLLERSFYQSSRDTLLKSCMQFIRVTNSSDAFNKIRTNYRIKKLPAILLFCQGKLAKNQSGVPFYIQYPYAPTQLKEQFARVIERNRVPLEKLPKGFVNIPASLYFKGGYEGPFWDCYHPYWYAPYAFYPWAYSYPYEYGYPIRGAGFGINLSF